MTHDGLGTAEPRRTRRTRRAAMISIPIASLGLVLVILPSASAEGPGYGGAADRLSVSWTTTSSAVTAEPPPASTYSNDSSDPTGSQAGARVTFHGSRGSSARVAGGSSSVSSAGPNASGVSLSVGGVGFRGRSAVRIRVGSGAAFTARADTTGTLRVQVPVASDTEVHAGMSVVALGHAPSGTAMTLVGSIPPRPLGKGPVDLVPWFAVTLLVVPAATWLIGRVGSSRRKPAPVPSASP